MARDLSKHVKANDDGLGENCIVYLLPQEYCLDLYQPSGAGKKRKKELQEEDCLSWRGAVRKYAYSFIGLQKQQPSRNRNNGMRSSQL